MATLSDLGIEVKADDAYVTTCPECSNHRKPEHRKTKCLQVTRKGDYYIFNCHNCGHSGSTINGKKYEEVWKAARMPKEKPSVYSKPVNQFLASKQLTPETALKCGCYELSSDAGKTLAFPYYYKNSLVNVMFRKIGGEDKKVWQVPKEKGTVTCFWGLEAVNLISKNEIIITEGQTDRMTWVQAGFENVLSVPMGAPAPGSQDHEKKLEFVTDPYIVKMFEGVSKFYLATDNDPAGLFLRDLLADKLGKDRCYILNYPSGYKDSNEVFAGDAKKDLDPKGVQGIQDLYKSARPYPVRGVMRVSDVRHKIMHYRKHGLEKGMSCGHEAVDNLFTIKNNLLMIITGISGMGKSSWNRWYLMELCKHNPHLKFVLYTPESRPVEREYMKMAEILAGGAFQEGRTNSMTDAQLNAALDWVQRHFIIINPDEKNYYNFAIENNKSPKALNSILSYVLYLKRTEGVFGFLIDAWNKIDHQRGTEKFVSETDFISKELDRILSWIEVNELFCQIIAHPTKMERKPGGNYKKPGLYDIKGSSAWYEKADIGVVVHRDKWEKTTKKDKNDEFIWKVDNTASSLLIVEKMKFDELGEEGEVEMWMDRKHGDRFVFQNPNADSYEKKQAEKKKKIGDKEPPPSVDDILNTAPF